MSNFGWDNFIAVYSHKQDSDIKIYPKYCWVYINDNGRFQIDDRPFTVLNGNSNFKYRSGRHLIDRTRSYLYKQDGMNGIWNFTIDEFVPYPDQKRFSSLLYALLKEMYVK
jgi:hypothetical protein